jgi:hypothetical protein
LLFAELESGFQSGNNNPDRRAAEGDKPSKRKPEKHVVSGHGRALPNDVGLAATRGRRQRGKRYRNIRIQVLLLRGNDLCFRAGC